MDACEQGQEEDVEFVTKLRWLGSRVAGYVYLPRMVGVGLTSDVGEAASNRAMARTYM